MYDKLRNHLNRFKFKKEKRLVFYLTVNTKVLDEKFLEFNDHCECTYLFICIYKSIITER